MLNLNNEVLAKIDKTCKDSGINYLAIFGSQARGNETVDSDVDLLIDFNNTPGLVKFIRIKNKFENIFNKKVDLVTKKSVSKYLKPYIQKDLKVLYG